MTRTGDQARRLAQSLANPNLLEFIPLTEGYGVVEVEAPEWTLGKTLGDLDLRNNMNVAVIAIRDVDGVIAVVPGAGASVNPGDRITLVGRDSDLNAFQKREESHEDDQRTRARRHLGIVRRRCGGDGPALDL